MNAQSIIDSARANPSVMFPLFVSLCMLRAIELDIAPEFVQGHLRGLTLRTRRREEVAWCEVTISVDGANFNEKLDELVAESLEKMKDAIGVNLLEV